MSGDEDQRYVSDGITEDIITELSRSRSLFVIARNSSFRYRDKPVDMLMKTGVTCTTCVMVCARLASLFDSAPL
jgi:hypothetical protein